MLKIGQVAQKLGLNPQTLYFYERIGLISSPQRTEAGYRLFSQQDVDRLAFIVRAKSLGLTLDEIKDILTLKDGQSLTCQAVYERLGRKVEDIQLQIKQLQAFHDELKPLLEKCAVNLHQTERQCTVFDS